ncbi:3'-5' exoribonuclease YhaM family protein [Salisediminibacterium halotolerans]|uniref:3'-5' exoribonuclease n=1 Tax=Salisediminibacterium halotolerans TaxID=517425 RepID=A0A1H9R892_9BACI|nr:MULTISPECIES: HD domain-containing protein [Salisediminibacterium]RLJ78261.1 3'-5' exoribonuclease [Actinophytocola xinjiangensis]RPE88400.1 3'-5' exoribonuclease [Salisediminibacterium halotolerans]TWG37238.1 3'-5' exoribonuclease [Salisediminibacterium halotolerans]SER68745.1 3'-5' exoribonuclease [Salisediminibacterium haloalkalitolerans]GEL07718.1 3'-5' exoribonuclease YhaM [Salisediminibacterium halotolerans]
MIDDLLELTEENQSFQGLGLIRSAQLGQTKKGDPFYNVSFAKGKKEIPVKIWSDQIEGREEEVKEILQEGSVIFIEGDTSKFRDQLQMTARAFRKADDHEYTLGDFLETAPEPIGSMQEELNEYLEEIVDPLVKEIVSSIYERYKKPFSQYPAAVKNHHSFIGGLLYHTVCMIRLGKDICTRYPTINPDFIIGGIVLHDAAKVLEYTDAIAPQYSMPGEFIGHISMSSMLVDREKERILREREEKLTALEQEAVYHLQHCILSHHGKTEWGSPVEPKSLEAHIIHLIDMIDSRVNMIDRGLAEAEEGAFTNVFPLGKLYKPYSK